MTSKAEKFMKERLILSRKDWILTMADFAEFQTTELRKINNELRKQVKQWESIPNLQELRKEVERLEEELYMMTRTAGNARTRMLKLQKEKEEMAEAVKKLGEIEVYSTSRKPISEFYGEEFNEIMKLLTTSPLNKEER